MSKTKTTGFGEFGNGSSTYEGVGPKDKNKEKGGASRFFYCPKAAKSDRNEGLDEFEKKGNKFMATKNGTGETSKGMERFTTEPKANHHPTVKPIKLMSYLITLFTRPGDWVLDPFGGSGTTGLACKLLDRNHIYIDFTQEYYDIAEERFNVSKQDLKKLLKEKISNGQQELF